MFSENLRYAIHRFRFFATNSDFLILIFICRGLRIFQTMNSVRSNNLSLKYHKFTPSGCKDIGTRNFVFVANTH